MYSVCPSHYRKTKFRSGRCGRNVKIVKRLHNRRNGPEMTAVVIHGMDQQSPQNQGPDRCGDHDRY